MWRRTAVTPTESARRGLLFLPLSAMFFCAAAPRAAAQGASDGITTPVATFTLRGPHDDDADVGRGSAMAPRFRDAFHLLGGRSVFGKALGEVRESLVPGVLVQEFAGAPADRDGKPGAVLVYTESSGTPRVFAVTGPMAALYLSLGGPDSLLGEPVTNAITAESVSARRARVQIFRFGIAVTTEAGTFTVTGPLYQRYRREGEWRRFWGFPVMDAAPDGQSQEFEAGRLQLIGPVFTPTAALPAVTSSAPARGVIQVVSPAGLNPDCDLFGNRRPWNRRDNRPNPPPARPEPERPRLPSTLTSRLGKDLIPSVARPASVQNLVRRVQEAREAQKRDRPTPKR